MEENTNTSLFTFDSPKGQSSYIKVIGVGGGGGNAVNHMFKQGIEGVDFIVCNTDMKALNASPVPNKIPLGDLGLGAGNKPERARKAALDKADEIRDAISHNTQMLFITAGMGGGTGTGAAPVIAEIAKSIELDNDENRQILVVAIVTRPFSFEGRRRSEQAEAGIEELRKYVDSIIVINNDKLRSYGNMRISEAFGMADDVLLTAAKGIAEIITENAYVNRDFQDINTVMEHSGTALMGTGSGRGENRALEAIEGATTSVLLDDSDISGAKNVLLYFTYSTDHEMTMDEQVEITNYVLDKTEGTADIIWGAGPDETLGDELKVILIATGFEKSDNNEATVMELEPIAEPVQPTPAPQPTDIDDFRIIHSAPEAPVAVAKPATPAAPADVVVTPAPAAPKATLPEPPVIIVQQPVAPQPECPQAPIMSNPLNADKVTPEKVVMPTPETSERRVFVLEDDEVEEPSIAEARRIAEAQTKVAPKTDPAVDAIRVVESPEPQRVAASPFSTAFQNDNDVTTAAERIARIHELLRTNPDGADIVGRMRSQESLYEGLHSSQREATGVSMRANGEVVKNPYLFNNQPD